MPKIRVAAGDLNVSLPNIPDIKPKISLERCKTIELLLSAIALEEISLSHLLNAEAEKLQYFLKKQTFCINDFIKLNQSINHTLRTVIKSQIILHFKLEDTISLDHDHCKGKTCTCKKKKEKKKKPAKTHPCCCPD